MNKNNRPPSPPAERVALRRAALAGYRLEYALTRTPLKNGGASYSVTVTISGKGPSQTAAVLDIARSHGRASALFSALVNARVTPCALRDVLEELL